MRPHHSCKSPIIIIVLELHAAWRANNRHAYCIVCLPYHKRSAELAWSCASPALPPLLVSVCLLHACPVPALLLTQMAVRTCG